MKLSELKSCIDQAVENAGELDPKVEIWYKKKMYRIVDVGQFGIIPDVTITIGPPELDLNADYKKQAL